MLPMIVLGCIVLVAGIVSLLLPETLGSHMPQTLEDAETDLKINATTLRGNISRLCGKEKQKHTSRIILNQFVLFSVCLSHFLFWSRNLVCQHTV